MSVEADEMANGKTEESAASWRPKLTPRDLYDDGELEDKGRLTPRVSGRQCGMVV